MMTFLTALHVIVCVFLILVVLLQAGKGGGMGIAFGGGGSQTVFGSSGAGNFLTRLTSITALVFMVTSLGLAHYSSQQDSRRLQKLAERQAVEKKAEADRAAKLKTDLEKSSQSKSPAPVVPGAGAPAAAPAVVPAPAPAETPAKSDAPAGSKPAGAGKAAGKPTSADANKAVAPAKAAKSDGTAAGAVEQTPPRKRRRPAKVDTEESGTPAAPEATPEPAPAPAE